jgi:hypothetical protein
MLASSEGSEEEHQGEHPTNVTESIPNCLGSQLDFQFCIYKEDLNLFSI